MESRGGAPRGLDEEPTDDDRSPPTEARRPDRGAVPRVRPRFAGPAQARRQDAALSALPTAGDPAPGRTPGGAAGRGADRRAARRGVARVARRGAAPGG